MWTKWIFWNKINLYIQLDFWITFGQAVCSGRFLLFTLRIILIWLVGTMFTNNMQIFEAFLKNQKISAKASQNHSINEIYIICTSKTNLIQLSTVLWFSVGNCKNPTWKTLALRWQPFFPAFWNLLVSCRLGWMSWLLL